MLSINLMVLHIAIAIALVVLYYSVYNKFALIVYSKIGSDLYMQWAYRYYQLAKFSILLMAVVGTLILGGLLVFDTYWVN